MDDEIEVIKSIHCLSGECEVNGNLSEKEISIRLQPALAKHQFSSSSSLLTVIFTLTADYPEILPEFSLRSTANFLSREILSQIRSGVTTEAQQCLGSPMLLQLISCIQEHLDGHFASWDSTLDTQVTSPSQDMASPHGKESHIALLHLDHMRAKNKYIKTLEKWTRELQLNGRLLFFGRLILIIVEGDHSSIKDYISRQRSVNVDVDSRGHSCKERMLSVLCEEKLERMRFSQFFVQECADVKELSKTFDNAGLTEMFATYVKAFQGRYF